ncbi:hypothetical protein CC86DRAFT_386746 [Ophiobolus disseminans]|uniref:Uncharacterized protein n=1 Tax=Ophiobolus disseminans TaxID=1469910 RepID=A0A6A6ZLV9_9PLEO|nr:hypothetical protein CC86DRAFT_386746 [Ophiobolus disseminans]
MTSLRLSTPHFKTGQSMPTSSDIPKMRQATEPVQSIIHLSSLLAIITDPRSNPSKGSTHVSSFMSTTTSNEPAPVKPTDPAFRPSRSSSRIDPFKSSGPVVIVAPTPAPSVPPAAFSPRPTTTTTLPVTTSHPLPPSSSFQDFTLTPITSLVGTSMTALSTEVQSSQPTPTNTPHTSKSDGRRIGRTAGIVVGAVVGAIMFLLLAYWIYACARGINVCNCCGGSSRRGSKKARPDSALPERHDTYPLSGIGAAPRMDNVPMPYKHQRRTDSNRALRLQRHAAAPYRRDSLSTIVESER